MLEAGQLPNDIQAQLKALVAPPGCNATLFYALKKSFVQALTARLAAGGKIVSVPPTGAGNAVRGLTMTEEGGIYTLHWPYRNVGDYDQNGTVGITDITPIAVHYGHTTGTDPLDIVIDGDGLGSVGISDITPLAMNFAVNVTSYRVEEATDEAGPYTEMGNVLLTSGTGADQGWMRMQYELPDGNARWLRVVPLDNEGMDGVPSDALNFGGPGSLPEIVSVSPLQGALGSSVTFQAVVNGIAPFTYNWRFFDAASPDSSTDEQPMVTLSIGPSGNYNCSLEVSNASGSDTLDFVVAIGNPPVVSGVAPLFGLTGAATQFSAAVTGDAPFTYNWDFAGGATPDTATEESPTVTLGAPSIYDMASVSVSNAYGTVLYPFTLSVYSSLDPPVIHNAGPTQVHGGDTITFSSTVTGGSPMSYAWDFGDAATPSVSNLARPQVVITDTLTTFPINLTVTNPFGSDTYDFDLKVKDPTMYDETEPNNDAASANPLPAFPIGGWYCNLTEGTDTEDFFSFNADVGDRIQVTMRKAAEEPYMGMMLYNSVGNPLADDLELDSTRRALDYTCGYGDTYYLVCGYWGSSSATSGDYRLDIEVSKRLLDEVENNDDMGAANEISFPPSEFYGSIGPGGYDGDSDDYLVFDVQPGDLVMLDAQPMSYDLSVRAELLDAYGSVLADSTSPDGLSWEVQLGDPTPFYLRVYPDIGSGIYKISGTIQPSTLWQRNVIDDATSTRVGEYASIMRLNNGHPGVIYQDEVNDDVYFASSDSADGMGAWTISPVDVGASNAGEWLSGGIINNRPAAAYVLDYSDMVAFAMCPNENGSGVWNVTIVDPDGRYDPSVAGLGGYPAVAYETDSLDLWFAINSDQYAAGAWTLYPVTADGNGAYYTSLIELGNGCPGITFNAHDIDEVRFATCDTPDGSGIWTVNTVKANAGGSTSAALVGGRPAVVYLSEDGDTLLYSINSQPNGSGAWSHSQVDLREIGYYVSLAVVSGYPAVLYRLHDGGHVYYAVNRQADGLGEWVIQPALLNSGVRSNRALLYLDKPVCTFTKEIGSDAYLGFAAPELWP